MIHTTAYELSQITRAVLPHVRPDGPTFAWLRGVAFETETLPNGHLELIAIACDRYNLAVARVDLAETSTEASFVLAADDARDLRDQIGVSKKSPVTVDVREGEVVVNQSFAYDTWERFTDWRKLLEGVDESRLDSLFRVDLKRLTKFKEVGDPGVNISWGDPTQPIVIRSPKFGFTGLCQPMGVAEGGDSEGLEEPEASVS